MIRRFALICSLIAILSTIWLGLAKPAYAQATILPPGETCFQATTGLNGMVGLLGPINGGSGYISATYGGVPLNGGSGSGASANITISGGVVTNVTILDPGTAYVTGDVLTASAASLGGSGSGFSVPVASTSINSSLAGGTVAFYIPNTFTLKQTWQDPGQTILNSNPVQLDANGCAIIYGQGTYRQIVKDNQGNTVWDQLTADTSSQNSTFWAGLASGTANAITVTDPSFNSTPGVIINFTALYTNTAASTFTANGVTAAIEKDTAIGPVALTGGEIVANNPVSLIYRTTDNAFHILNNIVPTIPTPSVTVVPPLCGANNLVIYNGSSVYALRNITAANAVLVSSTGTYVNRSGVSTTLNITLGNTISTAGGMDGEAPGTSAWIYEYLIDNGTAPAALGSLSSSAPTLPTGYTYSCRVGAVRIDSSGNLMQMWQRGNDGQYIVTGSTNTATMPQMASGVSGDVTVPTWTAVAVGAFIPPTATSIQVVLSVVGSAHIAMAAPSNAYGVATSTTNPPPLVVSTGDTGGHAVAEEWMLQNTNVYYASNTATSSFYCLGYRDSVNAN
jgi:hypothetical protein